VGIAKISENSVGGFFFWNAVRSIFGFSNSHCEAIIKKNYSVRKLEFSISNVFVAVRWAP